MILQGIMLEKKSEDQFNQYLNSITDSQLIQFYNDVEWTPFPILVIKEYQRRFKPKNKNEITKKLQKQTRLTKIKTKQLGSIAKKSGSVISQSISSNRKKLSKSIQNSSHTKSMTRTLTILEKLADLREKGIITNKEFQTKKKDILKRI